MDKNQNNRYFVTTNFYLVSFLIAKGVELANIEKNDPKRAKFVFLCSPQTESLVESFNFGKENSPEVMVDVRKFISSIKSLKDKLYSEVF